MKTHLDISHRGTIGEDQRTRMTFDENSIAHLMGVLTDLYSDPAMAVVREYSTNARDAHVAAGTPDRPIEVTSPTALSPTLVIKDYGPGLSIEQINENFSKYGWSSKRDSDEQIGMLGLGCKSGLSYASQFTMVSNHNGLKITVLVTRDADGAGMLQIIDTVPTDEPNGVEVRIPVKDIRAMATRIENFFMFWQPGSVLVDGEQPDDFLKFEGVVALDPDVAVVTNLGQDYLVMGDVPYPITQHFNPFPGSVVHRSSRVNVVARVPIGAVNFTPSREALHYTKRTIDTIETLETFVRERFLLHLRKLVEAAATHHEALKMVDSYRSTFGLGHMGWTYRGEPVPRMFPTFGAFAVPMTPSTWSTRDTSERIAMNYTLYNFTKVALIVHGYHGEMIAAPTKARARQWGRDNGASRSGRIIFCKQDFASPWLNIPTMHAKELAKIELPTDRKAPRAGAKKSQLRVVRGDGSVGILASGPTDGYPVAAWVRAAEFSRGSLAAMRSSVAEVGYLASVAPSYEKAFFAAYPDVPNIEDVMIDRVTEMVNTMDEWGRLLYWNRYEDCNKVPVNEKLLANSISRLTNYEHLCLLSWPMDPDLTELVRQYRQSRPDLSVLRQSCRAIESLFGDRAKTLPVIEFPLAFTMRVIEVAQRYCVLDEIGYSMQRDVNLLNEVLNALYIVRNALHVIPVL